MTRNHKCLLRRFGRSTREGQVDSSIPTLNVNTKHMQRVGRVRGPIDIVEQNVAKHPPYLECGNATIPMDPVENRLREILSGIPFLVEDALTRLINASLSSGSKQTDKRLNDVMEQVINEAIVARLESTDFRREIDETVEQLVAALEFMNILVQSIICSE